MALPNLYHLKTLPKSLLLPFASKTLNPNPNSSSLSLRFSSRPSKKPSTTLRCPTSQGEYEHGRALHPRPEEIPWSKELANTVHLIGIVGAPVQIKKLSSGKVLAWIRLGVKKSASDSSWYMDSMAYCDILSLVQPAERMMLALNFS